jgi:hypothetical protein
LVCLAGGCSDELEGGMNAQHTPARQCCVCEGFCLRRATIDEANTALAVARTPSDRIFACEALAEAAQRTARDMRAVREHYGDGRGLLSVETDYERRTAIASAGFVGSAT